MGCAESSPSVTPTHNHIPIERLYVNEDHSIAQPLPIVMITAAPPPAFVKGVLKKPPYDGKGVTEIIPFLNRRLPSVNKSVNFDEQVLVKARTPTPSKIWYEKPSSTMPMRKHPGNDDDDYDYDNEEEIDSISSDEEQEDNDQPDPESRMSKIRSPTPLLKRNQPNTLWHQPNTIGLMPSTNTMYNGQYLSPTIQQSPFNMNKYATEIPTSSPANIIKVRRRLPQLGPPEIVPASPYQPSIHSNTIPTYQIPAPTSSISPYQSTVQPLTSSSYQSPTYSLPVPTYQSPILPLTPSSYQSPQAIPVHQPLSNTTAVLPEYRPTLTNGESSSQIAFYPFNQNPIANVT